MQTSPTGVAAVTKLGDDVLESNETQDAFGFTWLCVWALFFILAALTPVTILSFFAKTRHLVSLLSRGMLFFLAVLISWLGFDSHKWAVGVRAVRRHLSRCPAAPQLAACCI